MDREQTMADMDKPSKPKTSIILPPIKKPNPTELRKDFKNFKQNKFGKNTSVHTVRRAGPRGG